MGAPERGSRSGLFMRTEGIEILLVEDNPGDIYLTSEALKLGDIPKHVSVAMDGAEALAFLARRGRHAHAPRPDLILLDLNLPKIDGMEVLEWIKAEEDLKQIPVLILSTSNSERDVLSAYDNRANCYLTKPVDLDAYLDLVQEIESYWLSCVSLPAL
jgi:chemotaxis family two-component system response regulator Rcp1